MRQSFRTPRRAGQALNRPPGAGDKFFKHVFDNGYKPAHVRRVRITPTDDDGRGFEELPVNSLDRADRISVGFRSVLSRAPATRELERMVDFLDRMAASYEARPAQAAEAAGGGRRWRMQGVPEAAFAPWVMVANVLLNLDETFTRE